MRLPTPNDKVPIFIILLYLWKILSPCIGQQLGAAYHNVTCAGHDTRLLCDCKNVNEYMTLPMIYGYIYEIQIINCKHFKVGAHTFENTQGLRTVIFNKIENLILVQNALSFPLHTSNLPLNIEFKEVKIEVIESHAISGTIGEIIFIGSTIETLRPFAFTIFSIVLFKLDGVRVNRIEAQAFKKFTVEQFELIDSEFLSEVPSKAFYDVEVLSSLRIQNVTFKRVYTRAFSFKGIKKLFVTDNTFKQTESEWIAAQMREKAVIKDNNFGITSQIAFTAIEVSKEVVFLDRVELHFVNNTVQFAKDPEALVFNDKIQLHLTRLQYHNYFPCKELVENQPKTPFYRTYSDSIYFETKSNNQSLVLRQIIDVECKEESYLLYIILGVVGLVLILILIAAIIIMRIINKRKKRKLNVVLPESRTYKETQIVYQIQSAGLLKTDL